MTNKYKDFKLALHGICNEMQYFFNNVTKEQRRKANNERNDCHYSHHTYWATGSGGFRALEVYLESKDYDILGKGNYSIVIECPWDKSLAIKIGHGGSGRGDILEDGWLSWAAFCMQAKTNKDLASDVLPDIYDIVFNTNIYVALVKRYYCTYEDIDSAWCLPETLDKNVVDIRYNELQIAKDRYKGYCSSVYYSTPNIASYMDIFRHESCPSITDLHDGNIMVDLETLNLIIIDPSSEDYTLNNNTRLDMFNSVGVDISKLINLYNFSTF